MPVIRGASLAAHAAAKKVNEKDQAAKCAAHVPTHALGPVLYSLQLIAALRPTDVKAAVAKEREWQTQRLPENLRPWVDSWVEKTLPLLPKNLRAQLD